MGGELFQTIVYNPVSKIKKSQITAQQRRFHEAYT